LKAALEVQDLEQFDYIVIDETQDLMRSDFFKVLSDLLKGNNIWEGDWTICIDEEQKIFDSQYDKQLHDKILDSGTQLSLNENLRNTKEIASWTYGLSGVNTAPVSRLTGAQPILDYYRSASEDLAKKLQRDINRQLKALSDIGLPASNLVVLLAQKHPYLDILDNASQNTIKKMAKYGDVHDNNEYFLWSTVQSFKGLEAVSIILLGIENIEKKSIRKLIYVGGSRARSLLTIFFQEDQADSVQNRLTDVFSYLT
jgi:DNA helicase IV